VYLDPVTRGFREGGDYEVENVTFTMTIPRNADPEKPLKVVVFGHGIMTERRFVLAVADTLARNGFAAVSIDLPYHGTRTTCVDTSPIAVVNPQTGEPTNLPPCSDGAVCSPEGQCIGGDGKSAFRQWPAVGFPVASGAAFLELDLLPEIRDHFLQAYIDLGSLAYALKNADWGAAIDQPLDGTKPYWVGQSLGGIIGATFVAAMPEFEKAVFNVPGADLVDMFDQSTFFHPQINGYFVKNDIERAGYEGRRFLNIARWLIDPVDPHSIAHRYRERPDMGFIQQAMNDFIVPNSSTDVLTEISGLPRYEYIGTHAFLAIPEPAAIRGLLEMGDFLTGKLEP
jgi:pimeloyl-ACP methyl ester carboxylesterase